MKLDTLSTSFTTDRLLLRQWRPSDRAFFAALNADSRVMEYFPYLLSETQSDELAARCETRLAERGWGLWAVETKHDSQFIGFIGLEVPTQDLPFSPCVEIGWRLAYSAWGQGYATEGAKHSLAVGFNVLGLDEIVSFTSVVNVRSRRVMEKLSMREESHPFQHPSIDKDHRLCEHCLYRITREQWSRG